MDILVHGTGHLELEGQVFPCRLGRSGLSADKREGDGATPIGRWPLRAVLYRADRVARPQTSLPVRAIAADDGWCDAPADDDYNRPVRLPHPASCETLWREDHLYDVLVVLGHNDNPPKPGLGSAIFLHVAPPEGKPTQGCVALALEDLLTVLQRCQPGDHLVVLARPE